MMPLSKWTQDADLQKLEVLEKLEAKLMAEGKEEKVGEGEGGDEAEESEGEDSDNGDYDKNKDFDDDDDDDYNEPEDNDNEEEKSIKASSPSSLAAKRS